MPETKKRGWDCWMDDCARTVRDGPLVRVNPKGEHGVFMCADHAAEVRIMRSGATEETDRDRAAGTGIYRPRDGNAEVGPYADPDFQPGMVVCAADRNRNDLRTWEAFQPEDAAPGEWWFDPLWRTTVACGWEKRVDLPSRLAVVDGCGFARGSA